MQSVSLNSVSRVFGRLFAVHRVSMELQAGQITALVGDNGSGKTTLLTLLATLDSPSSGSILYDDVAWKDFADRYRDRVGWVAHDSLVYGELSGRENLRFYGEMYGLEQLDERVDRWLEEVGLAQAADRRVDAFSRGMRQRLSIARALLQNPDLLLLDEPMTGLDRSGRKDVSALLERLRARQKILVVTSHDLDMLNALSDRAAVLRQGQLVFDEMLENRELTEVYREYA